MAGYVVTAGVPARVGVLVLGQWRRELRRWAPELRLSIVAGEGADRSWQWAAPAQAFVTSYETFRADAPRRDGPGGRTWDLVVLDEAQRIKNPRSELAVRVKALRRRRAWALSGTPLENRVADLASILEFVAARPEGGPAPAPASLGARQAEVQLRRRKADVLADLPPKLVGTLALSLTGAQRESYLRAEREGVVRLRAWGPDVPIAHVLELILRLKQLCNGCLASGRSAKLEDLAARLPAHMAAGDRVLVFSQFADDRFGARAIARHLAAWEPLVYTGGLPPAEREATLAAFKRDPARRLLVLSLRAGGTGLDLPEANVVYHVDRWWNPALMRQAEDRAHRHGQTRPVQVYQYLVEETIETRIAALLEAKQALFDAWIDPVSLDLGSRFGREELLGLVGA